MNKKTKKVVVVLIIIAILIALIGVANFYQYLQQGGQINFNGSDIVDIEDDTNITDDNIQFDIDDGKIDKDKDDDTANKDKDGNKDNDKGDGKNDNKGKVDNEDGKIKPTRPSILDPVLPPIIAPPTPIIPPIEPTQPPVKPVKPIPPIKPDKPDKPSGSGGGGGHSYAASVMEIIIPDYSHENSELEVTSTQKNVKSVKWFVSSKEDTIIIDEVMKGDLEKLGGNITFSKAGAYTITASAKNYGNRTYTFSKDIIIHEDYSIGIELEKTAHTDKSFEVKTTLSDNIKSLLSWHIYKDGKEVKWQDYVIGSLTNIGGSITIAEKGNFTLKAVIYDKTSKEFSGTADIVVLPVTNIILELPKATHTDNAVTLKATTEELGEHNIIWSIEKNGTVTTFKEATESELTNSGGTIRFKEKGDYKVIATVTDKANRTYTQSAEIKVYPVASFSFELPKTAHTDKEIDIVVKSSELQEMKAEWTIFKDGKIVPPALAIKGNLTNEGGTIRFIEKGTYTLKATLFDELGREYSCEKSITVYPIAETGFYLPTNAHTDNYVEVKTNFKETKDLDVVWTLTKNGKAISLADGFDGKLTETGGNIKFKSVGDYILKATVTDTTGRSFSFEASTKVYPVIVVKTELTEQTHTDKSVMVKASTTNAGTLPIKWVFIQNDIAVEVKHSLSNSGGVIELKEKGDYIVTAQITDETGRVFAVDQLIKVYPVPTMTFNTPNAAHTDDVLDFVASSTDMENLNAVWYVDNTHGFQDWETYVDGTLRNNGGSIRFKRAGVYDLQARVTDETGRVFRYNSGKIEILPILDLSFILPKTGYTDTTIDIRTRGNNGVLPVEWALMKNGEIIPLEQGFNGTLNNNGGKINFTSNGEYRLTATMFDALGRIFTASEQISIYPLYNCNFTMPSTVRTGQSFVVNMSDKVNLSEQNIVWTATKNGAAITVDDYFNGTLNNKGGTVTVVKAGEYTLTATITDELDRVFTASQSISVVNTAPTKPTITADVTRTANNIKFLVNLNVNSTDLDGDAITYEYEGKTSDNYYAIGTHTVKVRAKDSYGGISEWAEVTFAVANSAPTRPSITADVTRTSKNGEFLTNLTVNSTDPDGDTFTYEYGSKASDNYYAVGSHTVRVRAKDSYGGVSLWGEVRFTIVNSAPTRPVITRTPNGNSVAPGTPVKITASSSDPDGDSITYVWEGRPKETQTYPLGKNVVKVKAVDSTGAESPWAAIVFFVMDSSGSGGMTLTGPDSTINENGIDGATITNYTFTVPPVSGHSGADYGRVRGYNINTGAWDQLDYGTTINGITFSKTLTAGTYSKLEFYYYTNHSCMYNKANITYTVEYYWN